jgi:hypothetical protein
MLAMPLGWSLGISVIDKDACALVRQQAPAKKASGRFMSRLSNAHEARQEAQQRLGEQMVPVLGSEGEGK